MSSLTIVIKKDILTEITPTLVQILVVKKLQWQLLELSTIIMGLRLVCWPMKNSTLQGFHFKGWAWALSRSTSEKSP